MKKDDLFSAFKEFELKKNQQTVVVGGAANGTDCTKTFPTTSDGGGPTYKDNDQICGDDDEDVTRISYKGKFYKGN